MIEIARARVQADIEAVRLSKMYTNPSLLEGVAIPRFRLPDLTIDLPIVIEGGGDEGLVNKMVTPPSNSDIDNIVDRAISSTGITFSSTSTTQLHKLVRESVAKYYTAGLDVSQSISATQNILSESVTSFEKTREIVSITPKDKFDQDKTKIVNTFKSVLQNLLQRQVLDSFTKNSRVLIRAETATVRESQNPSSITRLTINLREDGFELVSITEPDGSSDQRLIPE